LAEDFHQSVLTGSATTTEATTDTIPQPTAERIKAVEQLFFNLWGRLIEPTLSRDSRLTAADGYEIVGGLARHLASYDGPLEDEPFQSWAAETVTLPIAFAVFRREHSKAVLKGVWSVLRNCADLGFEPSTDIPSLENQTWFKVWENLEDWLIPGKAKVSTRLYAMARDQARGWRTNRLRERKKWVSMESFLQKEEAGSPKPKPIILGPGDEGAYLPPEHAGHAGLEAHHIPISDEMFDAT
jgi:hypothetical protein